jgi:tRNA_anti-like
MKHAISLMIALLMAACSDTQISITAKQQGILDDLMHSEVQTLNSNGDSFIITLDTVSAKELTKEYDDNEVKANVKYKNKKLKVDGVVETINLDFKGDAFLTLLGYQPFHDVHAVLLKKEDGANLRKTERISLVCDSPRKVIATVMLNNCQFTSEWARSQVDDFKNGVRKTILGKTTGNKQHVKVAAVVLYLAEALPENTRCGKNISDCAVEVSTAFAKMDKQKLDDAKQLLAKRGVKVD